MTCPRVRRRCLEYLSGAQWEKLKLGHKCSPTLEKGVSPLSSSIKGRLFRSSQTPTDRQGLPARGRCATCRPRGPCSAHLPRASTRTLAGTSRPVPSTALTAHEAGPECGACRGFLRVTWAARGRGHLAPVAWSTWGRRGAASSKARPAASPGKGS